MRPLLFAALLVAALFAQDDSGLPPRPKPSDYPVHENARIADIAAIIISADQVRKEFSAEIARGYTVVEVAIYPQDPHTFDVDLLDFSLKIGDRVVHADKPADISIPWSGRKPPTLGNNGPSVTTETGVIVARGTDPVTGRPRTTTGTYEGVGVSNYPNYPDNPPSPPTPKPDQTAVRERVRQRSLPLGPTAKPVAGYLFFPEYGKRRKNDAVALNYSKDDVSIDLKFPK